MLVTRQMYGETERFEVGDIISYTLKNGEKAQAMAVKQDGANMVFCQIDCLKKEYPMNFANTNEGGYDESFLRKVLNVSILEIFPEEIRDCMEPFENGDLLRIPTEKEMFGKNIYGDNDPEDVAQWEAMKLLRNRIAFQGDNGKWERSWLQNAAAASSTDFCLCDCNGGAIDYSASYLYGVRPVFQLA